MKTLMKKKTVNLYSYDELSPMAQSTAANEHINSMLEDDISFLSPAAQKAVEKAEAMRTPWFAGEYIWEVCKHEIIDELKARGEAFRANGKVSIE